jgi:N-acetylneuraminic acid mutarotase
VINWKLHIIEGLEHPTPRSGHAMAPWYRRVFLFGGLAEFKGERKYVSDMWSLNLDNFEWEEVAQRAAAGVGTDGEELHECPCGRAGHNMVAIQSSSGASGRHESFQLYVLFGWCMKDAKPAFLGDISRYDPKTSEWTTLRPAGTQPPARSYAGCAVFKGDIYVFGGCNGSLASNFRNDMWVYETKDNYWQRVLLPQDAIPPPGRSQHAMVQYGGALYVFGGNNKVSGRRNLLCDFYR